MSSDWFEEALSELDEELDDEDVDREELAEELAAELDDEVDREELAAEHDAEGEDETAGGETDADEEADAFGFSSDGTPTGESSTAQSPEEFGFGDEMADQAAADSAGDDGQTNSADEFDADTGEESTDPFGFNSDDTDGGEPPEREEDDDENVVDPDEADSEDAVDTGEDDQSPSVSPTEADGTDSEGPSAAQSPEEFGFSLDDDDAESTVDAETAPEPAESETEPDDADDDPFGFGSSSGGGQGMGQSGDDDFGFGGFSGGGGGGGPAASSPEDFDDEDFDSDIDRIDLGIEGLDNMILGGVPERSLIGIIGGAGTGKTTFGLQFLNEALKNGERAVFITLEQTEEAVLSTAEEKGWPFREYVENDQLVIVVLDPVEMANSLASIRGDISRLIREFGASRLVLDSVSLLEMMYDHPAKRRSEVFDFTRSLKQAGVTTLLTSEASEESSHASKYGAMEYLTDAVFVLRYVRTSNFEETRLAIEIQKIRDANHSRATKPYDLTDEGMSVHRQANIF